MLEIVSVKTGSCNGKYLHCNQLVWVRLLLFCSSFEINPHGSAIRLHSRDSFLACKIYGNPADLYDHTTTDTSSTQRDTELPRKKPPLSSWY